MPFTGEEPLKEYLDRLVLRYNTPQFVLNDPVQFPRRFTRREDVEITALFAATLAWGNRKMILASCERLLALMEQEPYRFVMSGDWQAVQAEMNIHRTFFGRDLHYFCRGLQQVYHRYGSMEPLFDAPTVWEGIDTFRHFMAAANEDKCSKHLSNPGTVCGCGHSSACKRLHMMLRWLCRNDGLVDMGLWSHPLPSQLMIPLDVHVAATGRSLGLITRRTNDRVTVENLTAALRCFSPQDPVKYDFALFGAGIDKA